MKILGLKAQNIKKLTAVQLKPDGKSVILGGKNRAGKSSVLDCILYGFGGKDAIDDVPLRSGAKTGELTICVDGCEEKSLSPLTITRKFSDDGKTQLEIKTDDGFKAPSPQTILDDLCGRGFGFDPLAFVRMKPREQADMLRQLVGLDFSDIDREHKRIYDERATVNKEGVALKAKLDGMAKYDDAPKEPVSVAELMRELNTAETFNKANDEARKAYAKDDARSQELWEESDQAKEEYERMLREVELARVAASAKHKAADDWTLELVKQKEFIDALEDAPVESLREQIAGAESVNAKVRSNAALAEQDAQLTALRTKSANMTAELKSLEERKAEAMRQAQWPIEGLGFDASGVTLNGLPFAQASSAESLEVAFAMGIAKCPELRVFIIRDGALLDEDTLPRVCKMAEEHDIQVWIERVGTGEECSVIIEDGHVRELKAVGAEA